jgi:hypothetical protein
MKKGLFSLIVVLFVIGAIYVWGHRSQYDILRKWLPMRVSEGVILSNQDASIDWRPVNESSLGFRLEMPGEPKQTVIQATTEAGTNEPIHLLVVEPEADRTFAVAWSDKPPVARMNDLVADKTLDQARDGALARTGTTLVSESRTTPQGFPGRDIVSHNAAGGMLDTRLIYAAPRLYMLIAASPSSAGRHQDEVARFFNSFTIADNGSIPESLPAATR